MNKRDRELVDYNYYRWNNEDASELWQVYGSYSRRKEKSYYNWKGWLYGKGFEPHRYRILSANSQTYTFGCEGTDPETGACVFIYVTPSYVRVADMNGEGGLNNYRYL